jgi:hypothetical protein
LFLLEFEKEMRKHLFILLLCVTSVQLNGQSLDFLKADTTDQNKDLPRYLVTEFKYTYGEHLTTGVEDLEETIEKNPFNSFEARVGWRGYGRKRWQQLHNFMTYGVGLQHIAFQPYKNILGNPTTVYLYMDYPLLRVKSFWFGIDFAVGACFGFKPYDPENNPNQKAIGSFLNLMFQPNLNLGFKVSKRFDVAFQAGLTHFSDGRTRTPNKGVNLMGFGMKAVYNLKPFYKDGRDASQLPPRPTYNKVALPKHKDYFEFMVAAGGGFTGSFENYETEDKTYYGSAAFSIDGAYKYSHITRAGIGFDVFYDGSLVEEFPGTNKTDVPLSEQTYAGIHISHEFLIHRFAVVTQYGRTFRDIPGRGKSYVVAGARYDVSEKLFVRALLKTPTELIADFVLVGAGFTINSKK